LDLCGGRPHGNALHDAQVRDRGGWDVGILHSGQRIPDLVLEAAGGIGSESHQRAPGWARYNVVISSQSGRKSWECLPRRPPAPVKAPSWTHRPSLSTATGGDRSSTSPGSAPDHAGPISPTPP